jgi:parallel beta-helix repeat protein
MKFKKLKTLLAVAIAGAAVSSASAKTLVVGNDPTQCKDAQYPTINSAVVAAQPGDTVKVCPGTYTELVVVNKPLEIVGARKGNAAAKGRQQNMDKESIVVNTGQGAFDVIASDVRIAGFTVLGNQLAASYPNAGINVRAGSNRIIESNIFWKNGLGIYVNSGLQQGLDVERNAFIDNKFVPNPNAIPSGGVFAVSTQTNDSQFSNNYFSGGDPDEFCLNIDGSNGGLVISGNQAEDDGSLLVIGGTTGARVEHNTVLRPGGSAFYCFGNNNGLIIAHNSVENGLFNGIRFILAFGSTQPNADAVITDNHVTGCGLNGMRLDSAVRATVENNQLDKNKANGILLEKADSNHLVSNRTLSNGANGIRAETQSSNNTIEKNEMRDNIGFDADDETVGSGTAGTANFWVKNHCGTQNHPGLCDH